MPEGVFRKGRENEARRSRSSDGQGTFSVQRKKGGFPPSFSRFFLNQILIRQKPYAPCYVPVEPVPCGPSPVHPVPEPGTSCVGNYRIGFWRLLTRHKLPLQTFIHRVPGGARNPKQFNLLHFFLLSRKLCGHSTGNYRSLPPAFSAPTDRDNGGSRTHSLWLTFSILRIFAVNADFRPLRSRRRPEHPASNTGREGGLVTRRPP